MYLSCLKVVIYHVFVIVWMFISIVGFVDIGYVWMYSIVTFTEILFNYVTGFLKM